MKSANSLKKGDVIELSGAPHVVQKIATQSPSARGGSMLYKIRLRNVISGNSRQETWKGDISFPEVHFERRPVQYLYRQQDSCCFMDLEDYSQFELQVDAISEELNYLLEDMEMQALVIDSVVRGIQLPDTVNLAVTETTPVIKGASATARTKPATLETGLIVQVPEYLSEGETLKVDTRTGKYLGRA
jgi:elongation factor P